MGNVCVLGSGICTKWPKLKIAWQLSMQKKEIIGKKAGSKQEEECLTLLNI